MAKLGEICTVVSGTTPKTNVPEYWNGNINWITPAEIDESTIIIISSQRKITLAGVKSCGLTPFPAGTVILSSRAPIGKTAIAGTEMYCNQGFKNLICGEQIYNKYLFWFLRNNTQYLQSLGRGATFKEISKAIVENIEIPLPPLPEQRHIAAVLDKVSELIALRKRQLDLLDEMVKARFVEMFGDPVRNEKGWELYPLCKYLTVVGGYAFKSDLFLKTGIPVLRIGNINTGHFQPTNMVYWTDDHSLDKYAIYPGDLVMSLTGTVGKDDYGNVCILDNSYSKYYLNQRNAKLEISADIDKMYLSQILRISAIKKQLTGISRGVRQANISNNDILNLIIPIPPIELQTQFADFVQQVDKSKAAVQQALEKLNLLKSALMQEYFG